MKTRLISLNYRGSASVDPRYSAAMLPWTINDIRSMQHYTRLSVGMDNGILESYNSDFELQFSHPLKHIVGMCRIVHKTNTKAMGNGFLQLKKSAAINCQNSGNQINDASLSRANYLNSFAGNGTQISSRQALTSSTSSGSLCAGTSSGYECTQKFYENSDNTSSSEILRNPLMEFQGPLTGLVYLLKDPKDPLLHIYLFECEAAEEMTELMHQIRDPAHTLGGSVGSIPQTLVQNACSGIDNTLQRALSASGAQTTPASNLIKAEAARKAKVESNYSKMKSSKSYTHGLSSSAGTVHIPTSTSAQGNLALLADISPNHSHFFEVMYVGKIRVSHKRVPNTFIDDALPKFQAYDAQRMRLLQASSSKKLSNNFEADSKSSLLRSHDENDEYEEGDSAAEHCGKLDIEILKNGGHAPSSKTEELDDELNIKVSTTIADNKENKTPPPSHRGKIQNDIDLKYETQDEVCDLGKLWQKTNVIINKLPTPPREELLERSNKTRDRLQPNNTFDCTPKQRDRSASHGCIPPYLDQNRTMVFLVGRSDVRLISPDRKQVLLYKDFRDIASCAQGQEYADHFGIICREANSDSYVAYVFKCQSGHVCDDITSAISQAFETCADQTNKQVTQIFSCDHCPMLWYHKLCTDVEGLNSKRTQNMIFKRIESLTDDEQEMIWAKFYGSEKTKSPQQDQNQFLMMLLRAHCESRQQRHIHDTAENRSEFLNQYLGGSTIFMKAKRSLTNSFDHLLKRKPTKDEIGVAKDSREVKENSAEPPCITKGNVTPPEDFRSRSNTIATSPSKSSTDQMTSPMMDIFIKVGNNAKEAKNQQGSWRQAILNSVVTPSKGIENENEAEFMSPRRITSESSTRRENRNSDELRELWRTAIRQTVLLNRMEKENAILMARQNENELKRMKLDYEEIVTIDKQLIERWEVIIGDTMQIGNKKDPKVLAQAVRTGVPRSKRGDVWSFLAEQHSMNIAPVDTKRFPNFNTPYHVLLKNLTEHQHAIFIDLGRTFPNHKFYKDPLGLGQLSLFNLLKAYSILDPELGYCQGLGFICGILLLHCNESDAFHLLKHLMFRRQMRTKYLPDMKKFQLQLYQLSRLVKDYLPDLYAWLDQNDVSPTLYAAPWILTVFSSQFPLGFVARVFDMLFLESPEVIFKFVIALLTVHKDQLLSRENFEEIMDYLKNIVPKIENHTMEKVLKLVFKIDVAKSLSEYQVEYNVLQEEISTSNHQLEMLNHEKTQNRRLEQQLQFAQSSITQLETTRSSQQSQISVLQAQVQSMEVALQTMGRFINGLVIQNSDLNIPDDVRRILQHLNDIERQHRKPHFTERKINKSLSVNSHLGFPLKVLEELNEREDQDMQQKKTEKTPFFEHTYEQLRQQRLHGSFSSIAAEEKSIADKHKIRPNKLLNSDPLHSDMQKKFSALKLPEHVDKFVSNMKSPTEVDSGVGTPLSPPSANGGIFSRITYKNTPTTLTTLGPEKNPPTGPSQGESNSAYAFDGEGTASFPNASHAMSISNSIFCEQPMHPLGSVGEVNVRFNGITPLKSLNSFHYVRGTLGRRDQSAAAASEKDSLGSVLPHSS